MVWLSFSEKVQCWVIFEHSIQPHPTTITENTAIKEKSERKADHIASLSLLLLTWYKFKCKGLLGNHKEIIIISKTKWEILSKSRRGTYYEKEKVDLLWNKSTSANLLPLLRSDKNSTYFYVAYVCILLLPRCWS